jgi:hypothetical protein
MPNINAQNVADFAPSVTLAANEVWQCRAGELLLTTSDPTATGTNDPEQGILIKEENSLTISSGKTVWYRNFGPAGTACLIAREAV